ncbi:MAG: DUF3883 domain-containing protein [Candidatus Cloacimonadaceae bacterium]
MIKPEILYKYMTDFESKLMSIRNYNHVLDKLIVDFQNEFPINKIENLDISEYVLGTGSNKTFCYWVEQKLYDLGRINSKDGMKKYGVYYSAKEGNYKHTNKFGNNTPEAFQNVKHQIKNLIDCAANDDTEGIINNIISPMYKGKLLYLYFPDNYINIFAPDDVRLFLNKLDIKYSENEDVIILRAKLLDFKNSDDMMRSWSTHEYMRFLYGTFKPNKEDLLKNLIKLYGPSPQKDQKEENYPIIENVIIDVLDCVLVPYYQNIRKKNEYKDRKLNKCNYDKVHDRNSRLGKQGEEIVVKYEKQRLLDAGKPELASKVKQVSLLSDVKGYDVESYEEDGTLKFIEVKSTKSAYRHFTEFFITKNELRASTELNEKYKITLVFEAHTIKPRLVTLTNPFIDTELLITCNNKYKLIELIPVKFIAKIYTEFNDKDYK